MSENQVSKVIEAKEIMTLLPHRYPFLLVDRVLDYKEGEWLKAIKNISVNEPCFTGHFPGEPILPGVLILEALAQSMGILANYSISQVSMKRVSNAQYYLEIKWN